MGPAPAARVSMLVGPLVALLVAGCVSGDASPRASAGLVADEPTGALRVRTLSDELLPIAGANLRLIGTNRTASTSEAGEAFLENVPIGLHTLSVRHPAYLDHQKGLEVALDETTMVEVKLTPRAVAQFYINDTINLVGRIPLGAMVRGPDGSRHEVLPASAGSSVPEQFRLRNRFNLRLDQNWTSVVLELEWTPTTPAGTWLSLRVILPSTHESDYCKSTHAYREPEGISPVKFRLDRAAYNEDAAGQTGNPRFCPLGDGASVPIEIHPASTSPGAGIVADQGFVLRGAISYNGPLPPAYSRLPK